MLLNLEHVPPIVVTLNGFFRLAPPPLTSAAQVTPPLLSVVSLPPLPRAEHPVKLFIVMPFVLRPPANVDVAPLPAIVVVEFPPTVRTFAFSPAKVEVPNIE